MKKTILIFAASMAGAALLMGAAIIGYQDWQKRGSAPGNPASGYFRMWADNTDGKFKCLTSTGAACYFDSLATGGGSTTQIAQTVLGSSSSNVTFSSIPGTYTNLMLVVNARSASVTNADTVVLQANGDAGFNYCNVRIFTTNAGSSPSGVCSTAGPIVGVITGSTNSQSGSFTMMIPSYANTTFQKNGSATGGYYFSGTTPDMEQEYWQWQNSAAITSLKLTIGSGNSFATGSTFTLNGLN